MWLANTNGPEAAVFPSGSSRLARLPCLLLLWTNMLSEIAKSGPSTSTWVDITTWKRLYKRRRHNYHQICFKCFWESLTMSLGLPAFFKQFWLHLRKNFRKNLRRRIELEEIQKWTQGRVARKYVKRSNVRYTDVISIRLSENLLHSHM